MKKTISALLLSLPLSVLAADLKLDEVKGQYVKLNQSKHCLDKIVVDVMGNRLMIYDLTNGSKVLSREIYNETVKFSSTLVEGKIEDSVLTEKRYELKKAMGIVTGKKLLSEIKLSSDKGQLTFEENGKSCSFGKDLPEVTTAPTTGTDPEPVVEIGDITVRANTEYVAIKRYFRNGDELLDVSQSEQTLKRLLKLKSATSKYHQDVIELIREVKDITPAQLALALRLPYFSAKDLKEIKVKINEQRESEKPDTDLLDILTQNKYTAENYGGLLQSDLNQIIRESITELTVAEAKVIINRLFPNSSDQLSKTILGKVKDLSLDDKRGLISTLDEVGAESLAASYAALVLKNDHSSLSTDELLGNILKLKKQTHALVVGILGADVVDPSVDNFVKLSAVVTDAASLSTIAHKFLTVLPVTAASDILKMAAKVNNGYYATEAYKDLFLLKAADQVTPLTQADALKMVKLTGFDSNKALLLKKLMGRLTEKLSAEDFDTLARGLNNGYYSTEQYRDSAVLEFYAHVSETDTTSNLRLIDLLSVQSSRKTLALNIWNRDSEKSMSKLLALALKVENGYYSTEQYRDDVLKEGIKSLKTISVLEMKSFLDKINSANRVSQLQSNLAKFPELTVENVVLLISGIDNGYYSTEQYKDQALLVLLPKTSITKESEVSLLLTKTPNQSTKRQIIARGLKLSLPVGDINELVRKESDSVLKVEIIKGLAPKLGTLSANEIMTLISTIQNGYYSHEQLKFDALNFLLNLAKVSTIAEVKVLMLQRSEAPQRVAIYKKLKVQIGDVTPANLLAIADIIENGYYSTEQYKDDLLVAETKLMASVTKDEVIKLADKISSAANDRAVIIHLTPKIANLSDLDLSTLMVKIENGYYSTEQHRDDTALALAPVVKSISTNGINALIRTLSSHLVRKKVALILLAKKESVTKEDIQAISPSITNGYYSTEQYNKDFLLDAMALIK